MSSTTSEYRLEQERRQRLENAMNERLRQYSAAVNRQNDLLVTLERKKEILSCKLEVYRSKAKQGGKVGEKYKKLAELTSAAMLQLDVIRMMPPRPFDKADSTSTYCAAAEMIRADVTKADTEIRRLLNDYADREEGALKAIERLRCQIAADHWNSTREQCRRRLRTAAENIEAVIEANKGAAALNTSRNKLQESVTRLSRKERSLAETTQPTGVERLAASEKQLIAETDQLLQSLRADTAAPLEDVRSYHQEIAHIESIGEKLEAVKAGLSQLTIIAEPVSIDFSEYRDPDFYELLTQETKEKYEAVLDGIEDILSDPFVEADDQQRLYTLYEELLEGGKDTADTKTAAILTAEQTLRQSARRAELSQSCYSEYVAACRMLAQLSADEGAQKTPDPAEPDQFLSAEEIAAETEAVKKQLQYKNENAYIREQTNRIMAQFGYQIKAELVFDPHQKVKRLLFEHSDKSRGALCASYTDASGVKRLMLEVVGVEEHNAELGDGVNAVETDSDVLAARKDICSRLTDQLTAFCKQEPKMAEEFRKAGVILTEISRHEPDEQYFRQYHVYSQSEKQAPASTRADSRRRERQTLSERAMSKNSKKSVR